MHLTWWHNRYLSKVNPIKETAERRRVGVRTEKAVTLHTSVMSKFLVVPVANLSVHMLKQGGALKHNAVRFILHTQGNLFQTDTPCTERDEPLRITCCQDVKYLYMMFWFDRKENIS